MNARQLPGNVARRAFDARGIQNERHKDDTLHLIEPGCNARLYRIRCVLLLTDIIRGPYEPAGVGKYYRPTIVNYILK